MSVRAQPGGTFECTLDNAPTDLVGVLGFKLIDPSDGSVEIPRKTTGIIEAAPGVYWTSDTAPLAGDSYLIIWDYGGSIATEDLLVGDALPPTIQPPAVGYASATDVRNYAPELSTYTDDEINAELRKAERDIDWYAGFSGVKNAVSGLRFDPIADLDVPIREALTRATCAQVQYRLYMGPAFFVDEVQYQEVQGRDQTVRRPQRVGPQARSEFPTGLRKLTGRFA